jgi:hypothetical protein
MNSLIAMLISINLVGGSTGTQTYTLQGFASLDACKGSQAQVQAQLAQADRDRNTRGKPLIVTTCIDASKAR